jgi:hypothetical protein
VDMPRVSRHGWFGVEPGEATHMPHGDWSIIGLNKDQVAVHTPSFEAQPECVESVLKSLKHFVPSVDTSLGRGRACVKVDMEPHAPGFSNLNLVCGEPLPNVFSILPGKMTEAPYAADILSQIVCQRLLSWGIRFSALPILDDHAAGDLTIPIALRPIDRYSCNESAAPTPTSRSNSEGQQ